MSVSARASAPRPGRGGEPGSHGGPRGRGGPGRGGGPGIGARRPGRSVAIPWRGPLPWLAGVLALYLLIPIVALLPRLGGAQFGAPGLLSALGVSALTATISAALIALGGIPLAYLLARTRGRLAQVVGVVVQLPLALPPLISGILLIELVGPYTLIGRLFGGGTTDTMVGIVLAQTFVAAPFLIVAARSAFATVDPSLTDVAATLGHHHWSRFARISLPLAAPGIRAGLLLSWLRAFGEFGATVILAYHPYSLPVYTFVQFTGTGLTSTLAPTAFALIAAAVVLTLASLAPSHPSERLLAALSGAGGGQAGTRRPRRAGTNAPRDSAERASDSPERSGGASERPGAGSPAQARPATQDRPANVSFDLDAAIGSFRLRLAHSTQAPHLALLGPSGAGKSITLRCLAGLLGRDVGEVRLGDAALGGMEPERRNVGYVPQDAGLIPHLSVWHQVLFGVDADPDLAAHWISRLGLSGLERRLPHQLSGGQRQRVALARALSMRPRLLLLDEPFSALDAPVREELRRDLRRLQRETGVATVIVTHDPGEAAMLAEEIIVMDDGRSLQSGRRSDVFAKPAGAQVARLLGVANMHSGTMLERGVLQSEGVRLAVADGSIPAGAQVTWCVRPERLRMSGASGAERGGTGRGSAAAASGAPAGAAVDGAVDPAIVDRAAHPATVDRAVHPATVLDAVDLGTGWEVTVCIDPGLDLIVHAVDAGWAKPGSSVEVEVPVEAVSVWAAGGAEAQPLA